MGLRAAGFRVLQHAGLHVTKLGPWDPVPDTRLLSNLDERRSGLVGVDMDDCAQIALLEGLRRFQGEYDLIRDWYDLLNNMYGPVDAEIYYALIRNRRPARVVEIGSGNSTRIAAKAIQMNGVGEIVCIDPEPRVDIQLLPVTWERSCVETIGFELFESLEAGDILFIDSSHVLRTGGDVAFEYLEILPRLARGVLIHVHDIFLPAEYPAAWLLNERLFPTEQYVLQSFLAFNRSFRVVWGARHMLLNHPEQLSVAFSSFGSSYDPSSFWFERTA